MKLWIFVLCLLVNSISQASPKSYEEADSYLVTPGSKSQMWIDQAFETIFRSSVKNDLCRLYGNPAVLSMAAGVSSEGAMRIIQSCDPKTLNVGNQPKIYGKRYFLIPSESQNPMIESWTTEDNRTFILVSPDLTFEKLVQILTHEMAMSLDAKMNMMLTTFLMIEKVVYEKPKERMIVIQLPEHLSLTEQRLSNALRGSASSAIAYTFASLRAFQFETFLLPPDQRTKLDHGKCVQQFQQVYNFILANPDEFSRDNDALQSLLARMVEANIPPEMLTQTLKDIEDPNFVLPDRRKSTFCQYMASPMLSNRSVHSFFAHGPRPRVGGGWDTVKNKVETDPKRMDLNQFLKKDDPKQEAEAKFTEASKQFLGKSLLLNDFKIDLDQNKLKKMDRLSK